MRRRRTLASALERLGVRHRLLLGVGLLLVLMLLLAGGGVWQLRAMSAQLENVVQVHGLRGELAQRLHAAQLRWMERLRAALVVSDPEDLKAQIAELGAAARRYLEAEAALAATIEAGDAAQGQLAEVRSLRESVSSLYETAIKSLASGAGTEGALGLLLPAESAEARWRQTIEAMVEQASRSIQEEFELARRGQRLAAAGLAAVACLAMLVALVMSAGLVRSITRPINHAVSVAEAIAEGRLNEPVHRDGSDEFARLAAAMATMQGRLRETVRALGRSADSVHGAGAEIRAGSQNLSQRTEHAAARLTETASAVRGMTTALVADAGAARRASELAAGAQRDAQRGRDAVSRLVDEMRSIEAAVRRITDIVTTIDAIAFQTNMLALNAAVEASHAGEQGRGFSVVAAEVRELAQRARQAASQIRTLSADTAACIDRGTACVADANGAVAELFEMAHSVAHTVEDISGRAARQSEVLARIDDAVLQLDTSTQRDAALAEQLSAAAAALLQRAGDLQGVIAGFSVGDEGAGPPVPAVQRAVSIDKAGAT